jgi:hypothetical protein
MFSKPSILTRITVGKLVGLLIGAFGFFALPAFGVDDMRVRFGVLFWYAAVGAIIAMAGVITWHPVLKMKMPWWCMGTLIGAWMNFVLILIAWNVFAPMMADGRFWGFTSPWWFVLEGAIVGFVIGGLTTWIGGEGPETVRVIERA